jgi:hypothetical protein
LEDTLIFSNFQKNGKQSGSFLTHRKLAAEVDARAGLLRPGGAELVTGEADGRGPAVSGFDKKGWPFWPRQDSNSEPANIGQRNQPTTLLVEM